MKWVGIVVLVGIAVLLSAAGAFADGGPHVWLQPGDAPGTSSTGDVRVGCTPITVWAQGDASGEGVWSASPLAAAGDSGAHTLIGRWAYAGGAAAAVADVGALAPGRYRLTLSGLLARERIVTVDCARGPAAAYAPVMRAPLAATGGAPPAADSVPAVQLVAVHTDPQPGYSPLPILLAGGLLFSILLVGWSFVRR
jgi:hypothetical protein